MRYLSFVALFSRTCSLEFCADRDSQVTTTLETLRKCVWLLGVTEYDTVARAPALHLRNGTRVRQQPVYPVLQNKRGSRLVLGFFPSH